MAFKLESIEELKSIANTLSQYAMDAEAKRNSTVSAVEGLGSEVSGQGVDESLKKLTDSIVSTSASATSTLKYVSLFIKSQAATYAQNEDDTVSTLNSVESTLGSIVL